MLSAGGSLASRRMTCSPFPSVIRGVGAALSAFPLLYDHTTSKPCRPITSTTMKLLTYAVAIVLLALPYEDFFLPNNRGAADARTGKASGTSSSPPTACPSSNTLPAALLSATALEDVFSTGTVTVATQSMFGLRHAGAAGAFSLIINRRCAALSPSPSRLL